MAKATVEILKQACIAVRAKTKKIAGTAPGRKQIRQGAGGDISTHLDLLAEKTIIEVAKKYGLDASIIAEEAGHIDGKDGFLVIDPIDGTTNAGRSIPFYCCSIAYATSNSLSAITDAAIIDLITGELYWASKGKGAYVGSRRLHVNKNFESMVGIDISRVSEATLVAMAPAITSIKHVRQFGAAALELCFLARGYLDACIDYRDKIRPTDIAAGYLIAQQAGAQFYSRDGKELESDLAVGARLSFFAASPQAYQHLANLVRLS